MGLGSNVSPRREHLHGARTMLRRISLGGWLQSPIYQTPPMGPEGQDPYLNQVVAFWSTRTPRQLLNYCKGVELFLGRRPRGHWQSREIDLDLLYHGQTLSDRVPLLPHPGLSQRAFVLVPLCDIAASWEDPSLGMSVERMLDNLRQSGVSTQFPIVEETE